MRIFLVLLLACGEPKTFDSTIADSANGDGPDECGEGYADVDEDGYGGTRTYSCSGELSATQDDCDDQDPAVNPSAVESCETAWDDDCDGDDNDPGTDGCEDYYTDEDQDGYGSGAAVCLCRAEDPYTASDGGDCDDASDLVVPEGGDCGLWGELSLTDASATMLGQEADNASAGWNVAMAGDVDGDGLGDLVASSPNASGWALGAGAVWVVSGVPSGESSLDDATAVIAGETDWLFGYAVTGPGDLDGDGYDDIVAGSRGAEAGLNAAWYLPGPLMGSLTPALAGIRLGGIDGGLTAVDVSGADLGEGQNGVWIYDTYDMDDASGGAFLVQGPIESDTTILAASDAVVVYAGPANAHCSSTDGSGDADGDGVGDLLLGSPFVLVDGLTVGSAYLLLGPFEGSRVAEDADLVVAGTQSEGVAFGGVGTSVAFVGDNNGDGLPDMLIGAPDVDEMRGKAAWFSALARSTISFDDADAAVVGRGSTSSDDGEAGAVVAGAGDQDQDGFDDVAVPISGDFAVYLFAGPLEGTLTGADAEGRVRYNPDGISNLSGMATSVAAGDINNDGWPDVLIGSVGDDHATENQGTVYLFMGGGA